MKQNVHKDVYRFAYDEASSELRKILASFEQLCEQKRRVENLLQVLKPELATATEPEEGMMEQKTRLPNFTLVTRVTVL